MQGKRVEKMQKKGALFIAVLWSLTIFTGCSGGGSGPAPTLNYAGTVTPLEISEDNALDMLTGAYGGGQTTAVLNIFGAAATGSLPVANRPGMLVLSETLATFLSELDLQSTASGVYAGAIISDSETIAGSCGGEVYYDIDIDSIFGDFSGTADFREYCDAANPDLVLDGISDFSGDYDPFSFEIDDFSFIFRDLRGITSDGSFTLNGSLDGSVSTSRADVVTNSVIKDDTSGKTYWLKNFKVNGFRSVNYIEMNVNGRYYDHDHGYVDGITEEPFRLYDGDNWPASGKLVLTGAEGVAGGPTMARMIVLDADTFQVDADTDGDGSFDDYNTDPIYWADI